jgi:hypothetical protein
MRNRIGLAHLWIWIPVMVVVSSQLFAMGCFLTRTVYVAGRRPIIEYKSIRPTLPDSGTPLTERERLLAKYAATLEARVKDYNAKARAHNKANGYGEEATVEETEEEPEGSP